MKVMKSCFLITLLMTTLFLFNGCTGDSQADIQRENRIAVDVQRIKPVANCYRLRYSGTIKESEAYPHAFPVAGIVEKVYVREGQAVKKGQLLATLDAESYRNALSIAEAIYNRALDAVDRLRPMHKKGSLPDIQMVEAETGYQQAKIALQQARQNLDDCMLIAKENGLVGRRLIDVGSGAAPGVAAISIVQIDEVLATASVHESEISNLKIGMSALISVPALNDIELDGKITEIGVIAEPLTHTYKVEMTIANSDHKLKPGMICNAVIACDKPGELLVIPTESVIADRDGDSYVYIVDMDSKRAKRIPFRRGDFLIEGISVISGLSEDMIVVTAGQHKLYQNAPVLINNEDALRDVQ